MNRSVIVQALLFAAIAIVAITYGVSYVVGPSQVIQGITVTAQTTDAQGLMRGSRVGYRGVTVGEVGAVRIGDDGTGAVLVVRLRSGVQVPASAVARVVTSSALGDRFLDIQPEQQGGPFLADGDLLAMSAKSRPLIELVSSINSALGALDPEALGTIGREAASALAGNGPALGALIDNAHAMAMEVRQRIPTLRSMVDSGVPVIGALSQRSGGFSEVIATVRDASEQLAAQQDTVVYLLDRSPDALLRAQAMLDANRRDGAGLLANLVTVAPVFGDRAPSIEQGLTAGPRGLMGLAGTVRNGRADFSLVAAQGPVCVYPTERRDVQDESDRAPNLRLYCPPGPRQEQRGAISAPRPDDLGLTGVDQPGTVIGPPAVEDPVVMPTGDQIVDYWRSMLRGAR